MSERKLINRSITHFEEIYRKYYDELFAFALVITESEILAKDVISDVFLNLWKSSSNLSGIQQIRPYLYTSIKNQALKTLSSDATKFSVEDYDLKMYSIDKIDPGLRNTKT